MLTPLAVKVTVNKINTEACATGPARLHHHRARRGPAVMHYCNNNTTSLHNSHCNTTWAR